MKNLQKPDFFGLPRKEREIYLKKGAEDYCGLHLKNSLKVSRGRGLPTAKGGGAGGGGTLWTFKGKNAGGSTV